MKTEKIVQVVCWSFILVWITLFVAYLLANWSEISKLNLKIDTQETVVMDRYKTKTISEQERKEANLILDKLYQQKREHMGASKWSFKSERKTPKTMTGDQVRADILEHKYIIVHHTATNTWSTIKQIKDSWIRRYKWPAAHYIIAYDGTREKVLDINKNAGSTRNWRYNQRAIQIELIWNFVNEDMSKDQEKVLRQLFQWIWEKHPWLDRLRHKEVPESHTSCWGKYDKWFLYDAIPWNKGKREVKKTSYNKTDWEYLGHRRVTSYTPCTWKSINDNEAKGGSCNVTSSWMPLENKYAWKVVACPPEFGIGKNGRKREKLRIEWLGIVECVDRWSAIQWKHLDLFVWIWEVWSKNLKEWTFNIPTWYANVYYVE